MTIRIENLNKASSLFKKKDSGCYAYSDSVNFNIIGSTDGLTGKPLLDFDNFSEKEQDTLADLGFQYSIDDATWYFSLFKLGKTQTVEPRFPGTNSVEKTEKKEVKISVKASEKFNPNESVIFTNNDLTKIENTINKLN